MSPFVRFFLKVNLLAISSAIVIFVLQKQTTLIKGYEAFVWYSLVFMVVLTLISYTLMQRGLQMKGHQFFMQYFGAMFGIKVFAALLFVCYFIYIEPIAEKAFVLPFFILYFLFTGLLVAETRAILSR